MPAMTARVWENLAGLLGLGWAARGVEAEPSLLLPACAAPLLVGNGWRCWGLQGAGGLLWEKRLSSHWPSPDTAPSIREEGWEGGAPFPWSVVHPTFCFEFTGMIFFV